MGLAVEVRSVEGVRDRRGERGAIGTVPSEATSREGAE